MMEYGENLKKYVKNYCVDITDQSKVSDVLEILKKKQSEIEGSDDDGKTEKDANDTHVLRELINVFETNDDGKITIEDFSTIAKNTIDGKLPLPELKLTEEEQEAYKQASYYDKIVKYPRETLEYARYYSLTALSQKSSAWIKNLIPTNHLVTLTYIYIYSFLTKDFLVFIVPLLVFYVLFVALLLLTHDIFIDQNIVIKYGDVSSLVSLIEPNQQDKQHRTSIQTIVSYKSYYGFFVLAFLNLFAYFSSDQHWILSSVFTTISFLFIAINMRSNSTVFDAPTKAAVIAIPIVQMLCPFGATPFLHFAVTSSVTLSVSLMSILKTISCLTPIVLFTQKALGAKNGYYLIFLPGMMTTTWAIIGGVHLVNSSWMGLINCTVGWAVALIASPLIMIYILIQFLGWMFSITFTVKLAIGVILIGLLLAAYQIFQNNQDVNTTTVIAVVCVITAILIGSAAFSTKTSFDLSNHNHTLNSYCELKTQALPPLQMQKLARDFIGKSVTWNGVVEKVVLLKVENTALNIISNFPIFAQGWMKCLFGSKSMLSNIEIEHACSLSAYNKYTVQLHVAVTCDTIRQNIYLYGTNRFFKAIENIDIVGSEIWFNATFSDHSSFQVKTFQVKDYMQTTDDAQSSVANILLSSMLKTFSHFTGFVFTKK